MTCEADDPRHVDLLLDAFNLVGSAGVGTPGVKEADVEKEAIKSEDDHTSEFLGEVGIEPVDRSSAKPELESQGDGDILCGLTDGRVRFNLDKIECYDVLAYADTYDNHTSQIVATQNGFRSIPPHCDRYTGKPIPVMNARRERVHGAERILKASARRELIPRQLELNDTFVLHDCDLHVCVTAFVAKRCHFSQRQGGDWRRRLTQSITLISSNFQVMAIKMQSRKSLTINWSLSGPRLLLETSSRRGREPRQRRSLRDWNQWARL